MPKQLYKITQFHGGLNSNSDARDIAENELSEATDVMVDELGKIRLMGGTTAHAATSNPTVVINPGYGLFYFSHDRVGGEDAGSSEAETGDDYLALADTDGGADVHIYAKTGDASGEWSGAPRIDLGTDTGMKPTFYAVDGALRVSDGKFGANNANQWYGYIYRHTFGDGSTGCDAFTGSTNGKLIDQWVSEDQELTPLTIKSLTDRQAEGAAPDISSPVRIVLYADHNTYAHNFNNPHLCLNYVSDQSATSETHTLYAEFDFVGTGGVATMTHSGTTEEAAALDLTTFCSAGDEMHVANSVESLGYLDKVVSVTSTVITFANLYIDDDNANDLVTLANLSRMNWWHADYRYLQFAMSTIYDGDQESAVSIFGTNQYLGDLIYNSGSTPYLDIHNPLMGVDIFAHADGIFQSTYPRVTGFKIYVRRANGLYGSGIGEFALLSEVSIKEGLKRSIELENKFDMWNAAFVHTTMCTAGEDNMPSYSWPLPTITNPPYDENTIINVTGFKTAVIANRMAYIGHVKQDGIVYGDRVLKSEVNKFDSFPEDRKLEASVNDGDSIVKLEAYADRLLIFKKNKLELVNISQEVEFLEDTFMHKGVSHPAATCKTDFGIAWVNKQGCYLYDGQKVNNLLEKGGRQIIKESDWATFATNEPMIGYIPKKRQLIVVDDNTTTGTGKTFLYDMVTQSWVKGADATITSQALTNFVTDWNGDLVYAHTAGTIVKWSDAAEASAAVDIKTKDIDFGQPGQDKRIYKFYVTHRGSASNIQLSYAINGDQDTYEEGGMSELPVTSAVTDWVTTALTPSTAPFSCKSVRLRLFSDGTTPANFEINDITIVFRLKGQR